MTTTLIEQRAAAPTRWSVDDAESFVEFAVKTFWGLTTVRGRFDRFDGTYEVGPGGTKIELTIDGATYQLKPGYSFFFKAPSFSRMKLRISSAIPKSFSHCSR